MSDTSTFFSHNDIGFHEDMINHQSGIKNILNNYLCKKWWLDMQKICSHHRSWRYTCNFKTPFYDSCLFYVQSATFDLNQIIKYSWCFCVWNKFGAFFHAVVDMSNCRPKIPAALHRSELLQRIFTGIPPLRSAPNIFRIHWSLSTLMEGVY